MSKQTPTEVMKRFGLSFEDYDRILQSQQGVCSICGVPPVNKRLSFDHDHKRDQLRGLVCANCNFGLGSFLDDPSILRRAATYIESHLKEGAVINPIRPSRMPRSDSKINTGAMERFLRKTGIPYKDYLTWTGGQTFQRFIDANPKWTFSDWAELTIEFFERSALCEQENPPEMVAVT